MSPRVLLVIPALLMLAACAVPAAHPARPDTLALGRNAVGEPCAATRDWHDAAAPDLFDQAWRITCRNVAASRSLGSVRVTPLRAPVGGLADCGEARAVAIPQVGPGTARRCRDALLGADTVVLEAKLGGRRLVASVVPSIVGPAGEALRLIATRGAAPADVDRAATPVIAVASLPPPTGGVPAGAPGDAFEAAVALSEGINLNHQGLHVEASRILNDALSRLPVAAAPATRTELLLEAGLADSNIRFSASAEEHFAAAAALLPTLGDERSGFLARKHDAYVALDLLNQRRFREALTALDRLVAAPPAAAEPLRDPATVRLLNQNAQADAVSRAIAVPQTAELARLTLEAQANWARSIALLALGQIGPAETALDRASAAYRPLVNERVDPTLVLWLGAQIDRQHGRLEARRGRYPAAIASFDRALAELRRSSLATSGTGADPTVAETEFEQAQIAAQAGGDRAAIRARFDDAVDALVAANRSSGGGIQPAGMERYLDLLVGEAAAGARPDTYDRFFRATQAVGEPAVARQLSQLQRVVDADPAIGVKVRDRAELERSITRLRYAIAAGGAGGESPAALERERSADEARLLAINAELVASPRFRALDDQPATVAQLRAALRPGEVFLKIIALPGRDYGIVITAKRTWIYALALPPAATAQLAADVRRSIDGQLGSDNRLVPFDVAAAYALFRLVSGPASDDVLAAKALVVDAAGPLQAVPAGVLVTDRASVAAYQASRATAPFDFSHVAFLAARLPISTALSPRSFLVARSLPPSRAAQPFLGLGQHQPAPPGAAPHRMVSVGFGCQVDFATLADLSRRLQPIDRHELDVAATALGDRGAPELTGAAFSDTAVAARRDLADYQILHFATHGLEEGVWGCGKSPPALVTSFGDETSDGLLSFAEIARLRLDANLVVLSACDTAAGITDEALARRSGQEEAGSTLEGLVRAFLTANSRAVLATLWPVSADAETDRFIATFYAAARSQPIGAALQSAQAGLIAVPAYSHPFYWGPYFLVGDAAKMALTPAPHAPANEQAVSVPVKGAGRG